MFGEEKSSSKRTLFSGEQLLTKEGTETHIFFRREECQKTPYFILSLEVKQQ